MGKKVNSGPGGQNSNGGKPTPVPNKEIIQRMNFLHQAATLISGALYTPLPQAYTSKLSGNNKATAEERAKQLKTTHKARTLAASGQLIGTQAGGFSMTDNDEQRSPGHALSNEQRNASFLAWLEEEESGWKTEEKKAVGPDEDYCTYLRSKGLSEEQIKVKLNQRKQRYLRKQAKATIKPLEVGSASYGEDGLGARSSSPKHAASQRPKHPSQVQHRSLAAHYVNDIRTMARKSVLRMDPSVKRTMCRNCSALLIPGVTSSVKILPSKSHVHLVRTKCLACNVSRSIPSPPLHPLPSAQEAIVVKAAVVTSEESSMQEDSTPMSASAEPSTSHTISEASGEAEGQVSMLMGDNEAPITDMAVEDTPTTIPKPKSGPKSVIRKSKRQQRHPGQQRRKRHADPIVPGTKGQYTDLRFHERPENVVVQVTNNTSSLP